MVDRMGSWLGIVIAGALNGTFAVPMKTARAWKFEHIWGVFSIFAMVVIPWCAVLIAVPRWNVISLQFRYPDLRIWLPSA